MARHPGMQHNNRMLELANKITWANLAAMADKGDVARLRAQLTAAQKKADASESVAESLQAFQNKLITDIRYGGVNSWGLPGSISLSEWSRVVGRPIDDFYWNQDLAKESGVDPATAPASADKSAAEAKTEDAARERE